VFKSKEINKERPIAYSLGLAQQNNRNQRKSKEIKGNQQGAPYSLFPWVSPTKQQKSKEIKGNQRKSTRGAL